MCIWIGPNTHYQGKVIKVSNIPNKSGKDDCFTLTIPDFEIIGNINIELITNEILEKIKLFTNTNIKLINDFSDELISTDELIDNLIRI